MSELLDQLKSIKAYEKRKKDEYKARAASWGDGTQEEHILAELRDAGYEFEVGHPDDKHYPVIFELTFKKGKKELKYDISDSYEYSTAVFAVARFIHDNGIKPKKK